jgi:hypothetical protein
LTPADGTGSQGTKYLHSPLTLEDLGDSDHRVSCPMQGIRAFA